MLISSGGPFYFLPIAAALLCSQWMDGVFGGNMTESNTWWLLSESEMSSPLTRCVPLPGVCVHVCVLREVYRPVNLEHAQVLLVESDVAPECSWKLEDRQLLWSYMTTVILTLLNVDEQSLYMCTLCKFSCLCYLKGQLLMAPMGTKKSILLFLFTQERCTVHWERAALAPPSLLRLRCV